MSVVVIAGRKGGIGKSTIAGNLAGEFAAMGKTVAALDADPQHSLAAWAEQGEGMLSQCVEKVSGGKSDDMRDKVRAAQKAADIVLIDTPPGMQDVAYQAMLLADIALLPCGPSPLDLFPLKESLALALKARAERRSKKPRNAERWRFLLAGEPPRPTRYCPTCPGVIVSSSSPFSSHQARKRFTAAM